MKAKIVKYGTDGHVRKIGLRFDNGLVLVCTEDMVFCGAEKRKEVEDKLNEIAKVICKP